MDQFCKTIQLDLGNRIVELQMTPQLVDMIVKSFSLSSPEEITESHVKYYLINGMRNALETTCETVTT